MGLVHGAVGRQKNGAHGAHQDRHGDPGPFLAQNPFFVEEGIGHRLALHRLAVFKIDAPAFAVFSLPLIALHAAVGIQVGHNGGHNAAVGHHNGIPAIGQKGVKGRTHPVGHVLAAFTAGTAVAGPIARLPLLIVLPLFELVVALKLKNAVIHLPKCRLHLMLPRSEQHFQGLLGALHAGSDQPLALGVGIAAAGGQLPQGGKALGREGHIGLSAAQVLLICHCLSVADEIDSLHMVNLQKGFLLSYHIFRPCATCICSIFPVQYG